MNKSALKALTIYVAENDHNDVKFNQEWLIFILQMMEIWTIKKVFKLEFFKKKNSFCSGWWHRSSTKIIQSDIISTGSKVLVVSCSICSMKKSMTVSDNKILAEGLGDFFEYLGIKRLYASKKMAKNVVKNRGRALDITANVARFCKKSWRSFIQLTGSGQF